jgi:hypothetical protein
MIKRLTPFIHVRQGFHGFSLLSEQIKKFTSALVEKLMALPLDEEITWDDQKGRRELNCQNTTYRQSYQRLFEGRVDLLDRTLVQAAPADT